MKLVQMFCSALVALALGIGAARAEEVKLIFVSLVPPDSRVAQSVFHPWVDRINIAGKGTVQLDARDGLALANLENVYNRAMDDVVQVAFAQQNAIGGKFIRSAVAGLPFVSDDSESASVALWRLYQSGAVAPEYAEIQPLFLTVFPQSGIHLTRTVQALDDLRGLKMIAVGKAQAEAVTSLGGAPLSIPLTEMYQALQRGAADGAIASWTTFDPFRLGDVTRYHVETRLGTSTGMVFMAKKRFDALAPAAQKILMDNSGEAMSRSFGAYLDGEVKRVRDAVKATQQTVTAPDAARANEWRDKVAPNNAAYVKNVPDGEAIFAAYQRLLGAAKAP